MKQVLIGMFVVLLTGCGAETGKGRTPGLAEFNGEILSRSRRLQSADCPPQDANKRKHGTMQERIDQARCYGN